MSGHKEYLKYLTKPVNDYEFLLEGGQGKNINGNMFALLKEIKENKKWKNYHVNFVVTKSTLEEAKLRMDFYNYKNVDLVIRDSLKYMELLATSKYLITDNSFPPYCIKRDEQIMLNTWHGTPLKTLGRCDIENSSSISNVQKNFAMCDYVLFPNRYTCNIFMEDYSLKNILKNKIVFSDYPRNASFFDDTTKKEIINKYDLGKKSCYAYMPTWRGSSREANINTQKEITYNYLRAIDDNLNDDEILFVNLHFLIGNTLDLSNFKHIRSFPKEYETYDFLNVCDVLITDYSSVFFDFAVSKRKVVLFTYDLEEYLSERGTYFSIEKLPFPKVNTVNDLINVLHDSTTYNYQEFYEEFCEFASQTASDDILNLLTSGKTDKLIVKDAPNNKKENVFIHVDQIKNIHQAKMALEYLNNINDTNKNYIVLFNGKMNGQTIEFVKAIPSKFQIYAYVTGYNVTNLERVSLFLNGRFNSGTLLQKTYKNVLKREFTRKFGKLRIAGFVNLLDSSRYVSRLFGSQNFEKTLVNIPSYYYGTTTLKRWFRNNFNKMKKEADRVEDLYYMPKETDESENFYNLSVSFLKAYAKTRIEGSDVVFKIGFIARTIVPVDFSKAKIVVNDYEVKDVQFKSNEGRKIQENWIYNSVIFRIPIDVVITMPIQNKVYISGIVSNGLGFKKGIRFSALKIKNSFADSKIINLNEHICCYLRKTKSNTLYFTVRPSNKTDSFIENCKLNLAYYLSKVSRLNNPIILFEKDSSHYEESASVVFEQLIDKGYNNSYFILDKKTKAHSKIEGKYLRNIIEKYSFKHYMYFFSSKTFIGSEALIHALELRCKNKHVLSKINSLDNDYVFLQHGVMYMISLDSESRSFFKPRIDTARGKYRVVTSSKAEADHFVKLGGYSPDQVIICGLPKFDKDVWDKDADKITVMPTWRPWEYNMMNTDFEQSKYYRMLERIFLAIPKDFRDRLILLPHPLVYQAAKNSDFELKKYMKFNVKYDDILRYTKVLITDYSSIAYDAFYRGCNVIFYWEELDHCLEKYGPSTKLMLNRGNVFGDICYNASELRNVIERNFNNGQNDLYKRNYSKLVEFHDGKNTARLIDHLEKENII